MTKNRTPKVTSRSIERANLIATLGWEPELPVASERYCATTGELFQMVAQKHGYDAAVRCNPSNP